MPAIIPVVAAVGGAAIASRSAKKQTEAAQEMQQKQIEANQVDPRITNMLFGSGQRTLKPGVQPTYQAVQSRYGSYQVPDNPATDYNTDSGLLGRFAGQLDKQQSEGTRLFGQANDNYIGKFTSGDLEIARSGALDLMGGNSAPTMQAASAQSAPIAQSGFAQSVTNGTAQVNAPAQNNMDLTGSLGSLINGPAGANPYLTGAIQKGINQSSNAFGNMIEDAKSATRDILGNVRGSAVASGMYGSSRQGLAEGKAMEAMTTQLGRAASQFGQNNTDAAVAARAGAYDADRNRQLSATMGLSGQQYGVASQDASLRQQSMMANADRMQQANQLNANLTQQSNQFNAGTAHQNNQFNAGLMQGANQTNLGSQITTNAQNQQGKQAGIGAIGGLLSQASGAAGAQDMYDLNRTINVNQGLLQPYLNKNATPSQLTPVYSNSGASALGGAMAGIGMANQISGLFNGTANPKFGSAPMAQSFTPSLTQPIDYGALGNQALNFSFG